MSRFKTIKTQFGDDFGLIKFNESGELYLATSSTPILFGIETSEELLAEYFSKFRLEWEDRNFDWEKDFPSYWELVEVELNIINTKKSWIEEWIENREEWEELSLSEAATVISIIESDKLEPFDVSSSLHISESRYRVNDDIIRFIGAVSGNKSDDIIEKLKIKK